MISPSKLAIMDVISHNDDTIQQTNDECILQVIVFKER
jgi:hypothetical protein